MNVPELLAGIRWDAVDKVELFVMSIRRSRVIYNWMNAIDTS